MASPSNYYASYINILLHIWGCTVLNCLFSITASALFLFPNIVNVTWESSNIFLSSCLLYVICGPYYILIAKYQPIEFSVIMCYVWMIFKFKGWLNKVPGNMQSLLRDNHSGENFSFCEDSVEQENKVFSPSYSFGGCSFILIK